MPIPSDSMINICGQADYAALRSFSQKSSLVEFLERFPHPMLVGRDLYVCGMRRTMRISSPTMRFIRKICSPYVHPVQKKEDFSQSIFVLYSKMGLPNTFTVGRSAWNDIVLADISISKQHAVIRIEDNGYYLLDCGSVNGTRVENREVEKDSKIPLVTGALIHFGHLEFVFAHPMMIYRAFHRETVN